VGLLLIVATTAGAAGQEGLSVPLTHLRVPIAATFDTTWQCRSAGELLIPVAIDVHPAGTLWGLEARRHRVWWTAAPGGEVRLAAGDIGDAGSGFANRIFARSGLKVFTLDPWEARIDRYDLLGARETRLDLAAALEQAGAERIDAVDFCLSGSGDLYVLDRTRGRILQFDDGGRFVRVRVDAEVTGARAPSALEIDGRGRLFLLETRPPGLIILEVDGRITHRALATGAEGMQPVSLAVDTWGNAFVGDRRGGCVRVAPEGDAPAWSVMPPTAGMQPTELTTDGVRLWVADAPGQKIWVFTLDYGTPEAPGPAIPAGR
jgi:hypothetical protein